ncbi:hypothetical protein [Inediibacterium massiliense]|uniref:hypothetical protein n=1 Tax=Inediibacterium massiliense TaxID=1658111 RepID=UPI0018FEF0A8|nr:hypothetical protein [Inediibacterium massiliense]
MDKKYVIQTDQSISKPMSRQEAIKQVRKYDKEGINAYIVSQAEGERIKDSHFHTPKWS